MIIFTILTAIIVIIIISRRQEEVVEVQEDQLEKTCLGKFMEKLDHFNRSPLLVTLLSELISTLRRVRPKCRRAVKSQAMFWVVVTLVFLNSMVRTHLVILRSYFQLSPPG